MFSSNNLNDSSLRDNNNLKSLYSKLQSFLSRGPLSCSEQREDSMLSARASTVASDETFITPVSSVDDLMALSPKKDMAEQSDVTSDLLTGTEFDSICDVTMQEVPTFDDMLIDASSLDYLVKCETNRHHSAYVDRAKESLFVKFDPLYARKLEHSMSTHSESVSDSTEADGGYETGSAVSIFTDIALPKHTMSTGSMHVTSGREKPMQVVPPVVNSEPLKTSVSQTRATPALTRSVSAILAPTQVTTERLISISGSTPPRAAPRSPRYNNYSSQEVDRLQSLRVILQKQDQEVLTLRQENRELKSLLQDDQHKHSRTLEELECKVKKLMDEKENLMERENKLLQHINDKILSNKQMSIVMEEYEKTISSLIGEQQRGKMGAQELVEKLTYDRDQALNHLSSMESSFNDLLSKYERCKSVILETKDREKIYEQKLAEYEAGMKKFELLYGNLKEITSDNLAKANETLDNLKKTHNVEITKLNATIKKHEITIASLQESVVQKTRDNEELTRICDQLINEVREIDVLWCFDKPETLTKFVTTSDSDHNEGFSTCKLEIGNAGRGLFHGYLDTRVPKDGRIKNAGYAAMRSIRLRKSFKRAATYDWHLYNTLVLKVRGDGRSYLLNISCEGYHDIMWNDIYHYVLYTRGGPYWQMAKIPFSKFVMGSKGRLQDKQNRFRFDRVTHFGISCGDKIDGRYNLEIEYIGLEFDPTHEEEFAYEMYKTDKFIVGV